MSEALAAPLATTLEDSCWLPYSRRAPALARRRLRALLAGTAAEHLLDPGELLLSELVTNALEHARVPGRLIQVRLELHPDSLRIEVHDAGADRPLSRPPAENDESGRGLLLVDALAAQWGCCPRAGGFGKIVWCVLGAAGQRAS